eukprot:CAMPEP_0176133620 /NCGR_PEP_ID=MMETSP0120_2-20121206/67742_1 /TAXON_ID=160619 /ORGANISM="Kryptoperidinium foliaceum, Strain CCMP 1326" /LENGTH=164 /DNA_ID=CAMNT_0017469217 /DNA_START=55 /DNA_END=546 /DNA_ORIENTATION=-
MKGFRNACILGARAGTLCLRASKTLDHANLGSRSLAACALDCLLEAPSFELCCDLAELEDVAVLRVVGAASTQISSLPRNREVVTSFGPSKTEKSPSKCSPLVLRRNLLARTRVGPLLPEANSSARKIKLSSTNALGRDKSATGIAFRTARAQAPGSSDPLAIA